MVSDWLVSSRCEVGNNVVIGWRGHDPTKYQLIHFSQSDCDTPLDLPGLEAPIKAMDAVKYLGIYFDRKLSWEAQLEHIKEKTSHRLKAISSLGSSTWGIGIKELRHIYVACILPLATYGASAWVPYDSHNSGTIQRFRNVAKKLKRIQNQAGKAISGGYLRVAGEAYNIKLDLLPIDLYVKLAATRSALRLLTTPTIRGSERTSDSPLGKLSTKIEQQIGASISNLEMRKPYLCAPWKILPLSFIAQNDIHAVIEHEKLLADTPALNFYTDGSGIDENIGAAAVNLDIGAIRRRYVGKMPDYTVYSGEIVGVILALELAIDLKDNYPDLPVRIFADNQSAIRTATSSHINSPVQAVQSIWTDGLPLLRLLDGLTTSRDMTTSRRL